MKLCAIFEFLKFLKYIIFCSFLAILFKLFLGMVRLIKKGSSKSLNYLVASLMCSGGRACSKYGLNAEDEESFTTQEIYYKDNTQHLEDERCTAKNETAGGGEILLDDSIPSTETEKCKIYTTAFHSEEAGSESAFRYRRHKKQSVFRKLALASAIKLDDEQQQQPYSLPYTSTNIQN